MLIIEDETSRSDDSIEIEDRDLIPVKKGLHDREEQRAPEAAVRTAEEQLMMDNQLAKYDSKDARLWSMQAGKVGWALLWLLGVPLPVLVVLYLIRGH
jgi:hypothetical protein